MKKPFGSSFWTALILFVAMFALTTWAGQYSRTMGRERGSFQVVLNAEPGSPAAGGRPGSAPVSGASKGGGRPGGAPFSGGPQGGVRKVILDVADQGIFKKLVQPDQISISTGHRGGITNGGKEPLMIQVKAVGFPGTAYISSTDPAFNAAEGRLMRPLQPGKAISVTVDLNLTRKMIDRREVCAGTIQIIDYETGKVLSTVPVQVTNSGVPEDACKGDRCLSCPNLKTTYCTAPDGI